MRGSLLSWITLMHMSYNAQMHGSWFSWQTLWLIYHVMNNCQVANFRNNVITPTLNTPTVITPTLITPEIITPTLNTSTVTDSLFLNWPSEHLFLSRAHWCLCASRSIFLTVCFETCWLVDSYLSLGMLFKICCKAPYQEDIRFSYNFLDYVYASFNKGKVSKGSNKKFPYFRAI